MDVSEQLKDDLREGRIDADRLADLIVTLQRKLQAANERIAELEKELNAATNGPTTAKVDEAYSMRAEEKRQEQRSKKKRRRQRKGRRGRLTTAGKVALAERTEDVFPDGIAKNDCKLSHVRPVWRLENGRAVLIAYRIFRGPKNQYGQIPGCWAAASSAWSLSSRLPTWSMSSACLSTKSVWCSAFSRI